MKHAANMLLKRAALTAFFISSCTSNHPELSNDPAQRAKWLVGAFQEIAENGYLFDAEKTGKILNIVFFKFEKDEAIQPADCKNPYMDRTNIVSSLTPNDTSWVRDMPGGISHMKFPAFFINKAGETDKPLLRYTIEHHTNCSGDQSLFNSTSAQLDVSNLPGYACITQAELKTLLPTVTRSIATDGAEPYYAKGKYDDTSATTFEFFYRAGGPCALSISISQDENRSKRIARARYKFMQCAESADEQFCKSNPSFTWSDGDIIDKMEQNEFEACGTLNSLYQADNTPNADVPPVIPRKRKNYDPLSMKLSPCDSKWYSPEPKEHQTTKD